MTGYLTNKDTESFFLGLVSEGYLSVFENGTVYNNSTKRFIGALGSGGYFKVSCQDKSTRKIRSIQIHRLVYLVFKGGIPANHEVDHIDEDTTNNEISNLQSLSPADNCKKSFYGSGRGFKTGNKMYLNKKTWGNKYGKGLLSSSSVGRAATS